MTRIESHCVGCNIPCDPCCELDAVECYYCDCCGEEVGRLFDFEGAELCGDCVIKMVQGSDWEL